MIKAANSPVENCNNNKPQKQEEACKAPIAINFAVENPPTKDTKGKYTVQIDAYQDKDDAEKRTLELYNSGYKLVYYTKVEIPEKGTWFRVGIGFFKLRSDAEKFGEMLKSKDEVTNYIVRKVD
jgi:cell division protein FtsN